MMLGSPCSPCCGGCSLQQRQQMLEQLSRMSASVSVSSVGFVPQPGLVYGPLFFMAVAFETQGAAPLDVATELVSETAVNQRLAQSGLRYTALRGEPAADGVYDLSLLSAAGDRVSFFYEDEFLTIAVEFAVSPQSSAIALGQGCYLHWNLSVQRHKTAAKSLGLSEMLAATSRSLSLVDSFLTEEGFAAAVASFPADYASDPSSGVTLSPPYQVGYATQEGTAFLLTSNSPSMSGWVRSGAAAFYSHSSGTGGAQPSPSSVSLANTFTVALPARPKAAGVNLESLAIGSPGQPDLLSGPLVQNVNSVGVTENRQGNLRAEGQWFGQSTASQLYRYNSTFTSSAVITMSRL